MKQYPSWGADSWSACQEIPHFRETQAHYRVEQNPATGPYPWNANTGTDFNRVQMFTKCYQRLINRLNVTLFYGVSAAKVFNVESDGMMIMNGE
jgi:hypothetical protein